MPKSADALRRARVLLLVCGIAIVGVVTAGSGNARAAEPGMTASPQVTGRPGVVAFQRVAIPDDVPAHLCSAIAQDRQGLLWFGTQGGLVRYDGYEFRVFRSNPADPASLGGNYVRSILAASDGRLWVGSFSGGLSVFDPRTERFTRFRHDAADPRTIAYDRVERLAEDREGRIWISTNGGLDRFDSRTRTFTHFRHDPADVRSVADDRVRGLLIDREGRLWVGTRDGLQRWLGEGRGFERVASDPNVKDSLAHEFIECVYEDARGRLWIGTDEHGAAVLDRNGVLHRLLPRTLDPNGLSHYFVNGIVEAAPGEMWLSTFGGGVDVLDESSLAVIDRLQHDATLDDTIGADRVGAMFRDRNGLIWIGTWGAGLARHDPLTRAIRALRYSPNRADGLTHPSVVRALEMRDGTIWAGTNGNGIDVFDQSLHRIAEHRANPRDPAALADGAITCLAQSGDGTIWVATLNGMLHRLVAGASRFERIDAHRLSGGAIHAITVARDGTIWCGAEQGMVRVDPKTLATRVYQHWPGAAKSSPAIEAIAEAGDGKLWVGSDNGLYQFDPRGETVLRIARDATRADGLPDNWVPDLLLARDGRLWLGTAAGACVLTRWDGRSAHFDVVAPHLHRVAEPAQALLEDTHGSIWIGPRLRVDPRTWAAREIGPADGDPFRNFFIASRSRMRDGRLLFGSPEGLLVVDPSMLKDGVRNVPVVVTALRVEGEPRAGAATLSAITLSPAQRTFVLDVAALDLAASQRQQYRYKLDGLDRDWTENGTSRSIAYSRLPPGSYVLRVGVTDRENQWSASELRLPVRVVPAVHQTTWFRALVLLLLLALIYLLYRLRVRQLQARRDALEALVAVRTRELAETNRELASAYAQIEEASLTDPLTMLRNRRFLEQTIGADLEHAARAHEDGSGAGERDLIALMLDLDHFKSVNDTFGHAAGDAVLTVVADILRKTFRRSDSIVRWGGEEFLVVVRFADRARAAELAEKLRAAIAAHPFVLPDGSVLRRTCSIGVAAWPFDVEAPRAVEWTRVLDLADAALYAAKRSGRDAWVVVAEANPSADAQEAARVAEAFHHDPAQAVAEGLIAASATPRIADALVWE
jgi:diguanylate cyclase (GGDEF)-like protein